MSNKLKPCPCGNTVEVKYIDGFKGLTLSTPASYYIKCDKCGRSMMVRLSKKPINSWDKRKRNLIKTWNEKADEWLTMIWTELVTIV